MLNFIKSENYVSEKELAYSRFIVKLNAILGYEADEDDLAFDLYLDGCSATEAAAEILAQ